MTAIDIASPSLYLDGIPHERFTEIRETEGLTWHPYGDSGFWAVTRHADVREVSRTPEIFSSAIGHTNLWDLEADALEARRSLIDSDAPDHTRLRRVVSRVFTPRATRSWEDTARQIAAELVDAFVARGGGDWVAPVTDRPCRTTPTEIPHRPDCSRSTARPATPSMNTRAVCASSVLPNPPTI